MVKYGPKPARSNAIARLSELHGSKFIGYTNRVAKVDLVKISAGRTYYDPGLGKMVTVTPEMALSRAIARRTGG